VLKKSEMIKHKAIEILRTLTVHDIRKLNKFVNSAYFNRSNPVKELYKHTIKFYPEFNQKGFTKEKLYHKISQGKGFNDSTFRGLLHDLQKLIYKFLVIESLEADPLTYEVKLIKELCDRKYWAIAKSQVKNARDIIQNNNADYNYYLNNYLLESYAYNIESEIASVRKKKESTNQLNLLSKSDSFLGLFTITEFISEYVNTIVLSSKYNLDVSDCLIHKQIEAIGMKKFINCMAVAGHMSYVVELYGALLEAFMDMKKDSLYLSYKGKVEKHQKQLSHEELASHYSNLINYLNIKKNQRSSKKLALELCIIYEQFLQLELYVDDKIDYLRTDLFRAILLNALECKNFEWAENFIKLYIDKVPEPLRNDMHNYSLSQYYHARRKSKEALECIEKVQSSNFIIKYDAYSLKAMIFYEYTNPQAALDFLRTYSEYLRKDTFFSNIRKVPYKNFIRFTKVLLKALDCEDPLECDYIKEQILRTEDLVNKEWLLEKATLLQKPTKLYKFA
jgi:hypothetical protein